jgi:hypothetical protein
MALGVKYGGTTPDREVKERVYRQVRQFTAQFKARHDSLLCRDLLGCDIGTAEGQKVAMEQDLFTARCPQFVRAAAEILEELL